MRLSSYDQIQQMGKTMGVSVYRRAANIDTYLNGSMGFAWSYIPVNLTDLIKNNSMEPFDQYYINTTDCLLALAKK